MDTIDDFNVSVFFGIRESVGADVQRNLDDVIKLVHILLVVGIKEDKDIIRLLSDTLVGLGLTITDGKGLVEDLIKEISKGHETDN